MKTKTAIILIVVSVLVHGSIFITRIMDPKPYDMYLPGGEKMSEEMIFNQQRGISEYPQNFGDFAAEKEKKKEFERKQPNNGIIKNPFEYRLRFGCFGMVVLASLVFHIAMILTLKHLWSNKSVGQIASS